MSGELEVDVLSILAGAVRHGVKEMVVEHHLWFKRGNCQKVGRVPIYRQSSKRWIGESLTRSPGSDSTATEGMSETVRTPSGAASGSAPEAHQSEKAPSSPCSGNLWLYPQHNLRCQ